MIIDNMLITLGLAAIAQSGADDEMSAADNLSVRDEAVPADGADGIDGKINESAAVPESGAVSAFGQILVSLETSLSSFVSEFAAVVEKFRGDSVLSEFSTAAESSREMSSDSAAEKFASEYFADVSESYSAADSSYEYMQASDAVPPSVMNNAGAPNVTNDSQVNVGTVNIQTQATDAQGIAAGISGAINDSFSRDIVMAANTGVIQK